MGDESRVWLGLGSNLSDREAQLRAAVAALGGLPATRVVRLSSIYESDPWGVEGDQPPYLNMAAELATGMPPAELLDACLGIERSLGRVRRERWEPRPIDLDLILWGERVLAEDGLTVPHPEFRERRFVLEPLFEIAPDVRDPATGLTVRELLSRSADRGRVTRWRAW